MTEKIRVGVIGCGAITQIMHLPYLVDYDDHFEVVAVSDLEPSLVETISARYQVAHAYTDWREMLARDDVDAVVIAHSGSHYETVLAAVHAGKHVMVEKPLAWNAQEAEQLAQQIEGADVVVQLGYHKMYDPSFLPAREAVQGIGDAGFARITVLHPFNDLGFSPFRLRRPGGNVQEGHSDPGTWASQVAANLRGLAGGDLAPLVDAALGDRKDDPRLRLGYGMITISLTHQIYMMHGLLGDPLGVVHTNIWRDGLSIHALVAYPNDLHVTLDWHFLSHLKDYQEEYLICGNHQRVRLNFPGPYYRNFPSPLTVQGGEGEMAWEKRTVFSLDEAFRNELLAFHNCVVNGKTPATTVADGVKHMRFVQKLIDAAI